MRHRDNFFPYRCTRFEVLRGANFNRYGWMCLLLVFAHFKSLLLHENEG